MTGLRREVTEQDQTQLDYVMPLIQNGLNKTTKALSDCISVKDIVSSWYVLLSVFSKIKIFVNPLLKGNCPAEIMKLLFLNFLVISPNATKYTTKLDKNIL